MGRVPKRLASGANPLKLFWVPCGPRGNNFGDEAGSAIVAWRAGRKTVRADEAKDADLVALGSILHLVPGNYEGYIWGSGFIREHHEIEYPKAKIVAVRGKLTARRIGPPGDFALGDPMLIMPPVPQTPLYDLGIVPHYVDFEDPAIWEFAKKHESCLVIDILARDVPQRIASCRHILSSCLHGLIFADVIGVPNLWTMFSEGKIVGGGFKFRDYYSVFGMGDPWPWFFDGTKPLEETLRRIEDHWIPRPLAGVAYDLANAFPEDLCARGWEKRE